MAAWRSGVADLRRTDAHVGTSGALVRRYAATLLHVALWVAIAGACVGVWGAILYALAGR